MTLLPNIIDVVDVPDVAQWCEPEGFEPTPSPRRSDRSSNLGLVKESRK
jgi:hypothetical protein